MEENIEAVSSLIDTLIAFAVEYGFQLLGALVVLLIGLKAASFFARKTTALCEKKGLDVTLSRFIGNVVKIVLIAIVVIITLGNFGIEISPFIALAGASAFGATIALQGPLSNYGAGLSIILTRPFVVGNTINVQGVSGVVTEVTLAQTVLEGEDGERITVPNKEVVGQVIVNSKRRRVVQTKLYAQSSDEAARIITLVKQVLAGVPDLVAEAEGGRESLVGVHDFSYGGVIVGVRYWVASEKYFATRYAVNEALLSALGEAGIEPTAPPGGAVALESLSADADTPGYKEPIA
ncbi:MAG: mechanosensitive ion channel family protein [Alphaproteobacteria bacterium]|nr:mechanosensitive ion channel family protein [Alphaproteobacteria bacterium]